MKSISVFAFGAVVAVTPVAGQTPSVPPLTLAPGTRLDAAYLIGRWSDREDCRAAIEFRRDGRFLNPDGTTGTWSLEGNRLSFSSRRTIVVRLVPRGPNEAIVVQADGTLGYSRRCPGPPAR